MDVKMKANAALSSVITLFTLLSCTSTLWAEYTPSPTHRPSEKSHIYVTKGSLVLLPGRKLAVWHDRKLMSVAAVHTDHRGPYVYVDEMGALLATAHPYAVFSKNPEHSAKKPSKGQVMREKWTFICRICGKEFKSRDDLYDHIWDKHNAR
jgi:hypothetical protein